MIVRVKQTRLYDEDDAQVKYGDKPLHLDGQPIYSQVTLSAISCHRVRQLEFGVFISTHLEFNHAGGPLPTDGQKHTGSGGTRRKSDL